MQGFELFEHHAWRPFERMGWTHSFWTIDIDTILFTWLVLLLIVILVLLGRWSLSRPDSIPGYLAQAYVRSFVNMITQSLEYFNYRYFAFIASLFTFIFLCNILIILPYGEEPTKNINTTLALALVSFAYVQKESIKAHGLWGYIKEFFKPFFIFFPLEVLGKLATIVSLSFRLFGNIFGGSIISTMWHSAIAGSILGQIAGTLMGVSIIIMLFFGLFEGLIQAFVFSILTLTYLSMATAQESTHE